jgi:hypothetical protein
LRVAIAVLAVVLAAAGAALAATSNTKTLKDPRGDVRAADLDITSASVAIGRNVTLRMTMAGRIRTDASYTGVFTCRRQVWLVGVQRAAGGTNFFAYQISQPRQTGATGRISGRTIAVSASARRMGCTKGVARFGLTTAGVNGRPSTGDRAPNRGTARVRI